MDLSSVECKEKGLLFLKENDAFKYIPYREIKSVEVSSRESGVFLLLNEGTGRIFFLKSTTQEEAKQFFTQLVGKLEASTQ